MQGFSIQPPNLLAQMGSLEAATFSILGSLGITDPGILNMIMGNSTPSSARIGEDNSSSDGGYKQTSSSTFELSATKEEKADDSSNAQSDNAGFNAKNFVPANARLMAKSILNPSRITENDFSNDELGIMRQAYQNSRVRLSENNKLLRKVSKLPGDATLEFDDQPPVTASFVKEVIVPKNAAKGIQYNDYPWSDKYLSMGVGQVPISASFKEKAYSMATTVGRANYYTDKQGNVHVKDTYDFSNSKKFKDTSDWNGPFKAFHKVGEKFSHKMEVDINLGKINVSKIHVKK